MIGSKSNKNKGLGLKSKGLFRLQAIIELFSRSENNENEEEVEEIPVEQLGEQCGFSYKKYGNIFSDQNIERAESNLRNKTLEESFSVASPQEEEFERTVTENDKSSNNLANGIKRLKVLSDECSFGFKFKNTILESDSENDKSSNNLTNGIKSLKVLSNKLDECSFGFQFKDTILESDSDDDKNSNNLANGIKSSKVLSNKLDECSFGFMFKDTILESDSEDDENQAKEELIEEPTPRTSRSNPRPIKKAIYKRKEKIDIEVKSPLRRSSRIPSNSKSKDIVVLPIKSATSAEYKKKRKIDIEVESPLRRSSRILSNSKSEKEDIVKPIPMTWMINAYKGLRHYF